jgi:putative two-component system response regulator
MFLCRRARAGFNIQSKRGNENLVHDLIQEFPPGTNQDMPQILIVDDDESICRLIKRLLNTSGYGCTIANNAADARNYIRVRNFDLILCDVRMPGESGIDFIRYSLAEYRETAVIIVTGVDDQEIANSALEMGAYGYIIKPFKPNEIINNVANALRRRKLRIDNRLHRENLEKVVSERTEALQVTLNDLQRSMEGIIRAMAKTVEMRDPYTAGHQQRVASLARAIAKEMGLSEEQAEGIYMAGIIHDLGKISIPSEILSKPGKITKIEFSLIKTHPRIGYDILKNIEFPWPVAQVVLQHHERMDGSGYPQGLSGNDILLDARILGVADVVEAMASHRPYRPGLGIDKALEEIVQKQGILYDTEVVEACLKVFTEKGFNFE